MGDLVVREAKETLWFKRIHPSGRSTSALKHRHACPGAAFKQCLHTQGYRERHLVEQIKAVLAEPEPKKQLPSGLHETVDFIRKYGNSVLTRK